jgi:hypothetical protein
MPSPTEQLVTDVIAGGGKLKLPEERHRDRHQLAELVRNANRHGKTPPGTRLVHKIVQDGRGGTRRVTTW